VKTGGGEDGHKEKKYKKIKPKQLLMWAGQERERSNTTRLFPER